MAGLAEPTVLASTLRASFRALRSCGVDPAAVLAELEIPPMLLLSRDGRLPWSKAMQVLETARERAGDPAFALVVGTHMLSPDAGLLTMLGQSSRSIAELMTRLERYSGLLADGVEIEWSTESGRIECFVRMPRNDIVANEVWGAAVVTLLRSLLRPDYRPRAIHFTHSAPDYVDRYESLFGCKLVFDAPRCAFFGTSWGAGLTPSSGTDSVSAALEQKARQALGRSAGAPMSARVRAALMERMAVRSIDSDAISRQLGLSRSSLHRELQREGVSFKQVLNDTRRELAHEYLQDPMRSLDEVADRLGFADRRAFTRAFKRWEGVPPSHARAQS